MDITPIKEPTLIIMAAGMGSRYGGLKQIDPVTDKGEIIMDFSLFDAKRAGFKKVVFVIKEEMEDAFRALMDERVGSKMEVQYAFQKLDDIPDGYEIPEGREKPWGTGHAILAARHLVDGNFAVAFCFKCIDSKGNVLCCVFYSGGSRERKHPYRNHNYKKDAQKSFNFHRTLSFS